jgi:hypothetical protein
VAYQLLRRLGKNYDIENSAKKANRDVWQDADVDERTGCPRTRQTTCVHIARGEGDLASDSVVLCHRLRVLDKTRLQRRLGLVSQETLSTIASIVLFTLGIIL